MAGLISILLLFFIYYPTYAADTRDPITSLLLYTSTNSLDYQMTEAPGRSGDPNILDNHLRANFIVSKTETNTWSIHQNVSEFQMNQSPVISQYGQVVPQSLWDVETGGAYSHHFGDRHDWGLSTSVGSASDELFHSIHETILRATGVYHIPSGQENAWLFFLSYSNNRQFANNVPLPGFAYIIHAPEHGLDAAIGLPFLAVYYKPTPRWSSQLTVFGPEHVSSEVAYRLGASLQTYAGFDWGQQSWLLANRSDNSDRLFFDEKKWSLGFRVPVYRALRLDLSAGYAFNRRFYENDRAVNSGVPEANLNPAWLAEAKIGLRL